MDSEASYSVNKARRGIDGAGFPDMPAYRAETLTRPTRYGEGSDPSKVTSRGWRKMFPNEKARRGGGRASGFSFWQSRSGEPLRLLIARKLEMVPGRSGARLSCWHRAPHRLCGLARSCRAIAGRFYL